MRLAFAALLALTPTLGLAQSPDTYREAFDAVQQAVIDEDAERFAAWVSYPIEVVADGATVLVSDEADFAAQYHAIVTPEIAEAVTAQTFNTLFVNQDGAMFGNGQVWLSEVCLDEACAKTEVKIIAIQSTAQ